MPPDDHTLARPVILSLTAHWRTPQNFEPCGCGHEPWRTRRSCASCPDRKSMPLTVFDVRLDTGSSNCRFLPEVNRTIS
jgi:hypothetical protein